MQQVWEATALKHNIKARLWNLILYAMHSSVPALLWNTNAGILTAYVAHCLSIPNTNCGRWQCVNCCKYLAKARISQLNGWSKCMHKQANGEEKKWQTFEEAACGEECNRLTLGQLAVEKCLTYCCIYVNGMLAYMHFGLTFVAYFHYWLLQLCTAWQIGFVIKKFTWIQPK